MTQRLLIVTYGLCGDPAAFREDATRAVPSLSRTPGMLWKIWGLDAAKSEGLSAYVFADSSSVDAFVTSSPALVALRAHPDVRDVTCRVVPIDPGLSAATGAAKALGLPDPAQQLA
jgi:hypothetical protein